MNYRLKKSLSVVCAVLMAASLAVPTFAGENEIETAESILLESETALEYSVETDIQTENMPAETTEKQTEQESIPGDTEVLPVPETTVIETEIPETETDAEAEIETAETTQSEEKNEENAAVSENAEPEAELFDETAPIDLTECRILMTEEAFTCTGDPISPDITVCYGEKMLRPGRDYTISDSNNIGYGTATITIIAVEGSAYTGSNSLEYTILPLDTPQITQATFTSDGVKITWDEVAGANLYRVFRKAKGAKKWTSLTDTTETEYIDETAESGTSYYYAVRCVSNDGTAYTSNYVAGPETTYLEVPRVKSLQAVSSGIKVTWNKIEGAENYGVFRRAEDAEKWTKVTNTTGTSCIDTGAVKGVRYYYVVRCMDAAGVNYTSGFVTGPNILYLEEPTITKLEIKSKGIKISWDAVEGASYYRIFRKAAGEKSWTTIATTKKLTYGDYDVASGVKYYYTIRCVDADKANYESYYKTGYVVTYIAAPVISNLSVKASGVSVTWDAVDGAEKYRVYRKEEGAASWKKVKDTTSTSIVDTGVESGKTYSYKVRCINTDASAFTSGYVNGPSILFVTAPLVNSLKNVYGGVQISWEVPEGAVNYRVFRKAAGESKWTKVADTVENTFLDSGVKSGTKYYYAVRALSEDGKTYTSYYVKSSAITYYEAPKVGKISIRTDSLKITWSEVDGAPGYRVYKRYSGSGGWVIVGNTTETEYIDYDVVSGKTYKYAIVCIDASGKNKLSAYDPNCLQAKFIEAPVATAQTCSTGALISWNKVKGAEMYRVLRKASGESSWKTIANTTDTSVIDTTVDSSTAYYYAVRCITADRKSYTSSYYSKGCLFVADGTTGYVNVDGYLYYFENGIQQTSDDVYNGMLMWPLPEEYTVDSITSLYGYRVHPITGTYTLHGGLDIGASMDTPIIACADGVVVINQYDSSAGNWTVIDHGNGLYTEYMHQNYLGTVTVGQKVSAGEVIGYVGTTGSSTGYHLHLGVIISNSGSFDASGRTDPMPYLGIFPGTVVVYD